MCPFDSRGRISSSSGCSRVRAFGDKFLPWVVAEITHGSKSGGLQGWSVAKLAPWPLGVWWALRAVAWRRWGAGQRAKAGSGRCGCQPHLLGLPHAPLQSSHSSLGSVFQQESISLSPSASLFPMVYSTSCAVRAGIWMKRDSFYITRSSLPLSPLLLLLIYKEINAGDT